MFKCEVHKLHQRYILVTNMNQNEVQSDRINSLVCRFCNWYLVRHCTSLWLVHVEVTRHCCWDSKNPRSSQFHDYFIPVVFEVLLPHHCAFSIFTWICKLGLQIGLFGQLFKQKNLFFTRESAFGVSFFRQCHCVHQHVCTLFQTLCVCIIML